MKIVLALCCFFVSSVCAMEIPPLEFPPYLTEYITGALEPKECELLPGANLVAIPDPNLLRRMALQTAFHFISTEFLKGTRLTDLVRDEFFAIIKNIHFACGVAIFEGKRYCLYPDVRYKGMFKHELNLSSDDGYHVTGPSVTTSFEEFIQDHDIFAIYQAYRLVGSAIYRDPRVRSVLLGKNLYFPPLINQIEGRLRVMYETMIENIQNWSAVKLATYIHNELVRIHPFGDGNGRVARLLMNIILMEHGIEPVIFASNHEYLEIGMRAMITGDDAEFERYLERTIAERCAECPKKGDKNCSRCKKVHYCSVECQRKAWSSHKSVCVAASSAPAIAGAFSARSVN